MFDKKLTQWMHPWVNKIAKSLAAVGIQANTLTWFGFSMGLLAAVCIAQGYFLLALGFILCSRLCDALDGAVARLTHPTSFGGFLDITLDFIYYASIPLAFAWYSPSTHALAATTLLFSFMGTASSFLAYASVVTHHPHLQLPIPSKTIHYLGGLTEGFETLLCFVLMCLLPQYFSIWAYIFSAMCCFTTVFRIYQAWCILKPVLKKY